MKKAILTLFLILIIITGCGNNKEKKLLGKWENQVGYTWYLLENGKCTVSGAHTSDDFTISYENCEWHLTDNRIILTQTIKLSLGGISQTNTDTLSGIVNEDFNTITLDEGAVYKKK